MSEKALNTLDVRSRREWRKWLSRHHDSQSDVWLVFHKRHTGVAALTYEEAIEEALCFGWIDSIIRRLDDARYARKFTPRKADGKWSTANRRRYADLKSRGLLAESGLRRAPTQRNGDAPRPSVTTIPAYIQDELQAHPHAREHFERLSPSCRRAYLGWIESAKREETRRRRLDEAIRLLSAGKQLGME